MKRIFAAACIAVTLASCETEPLPVQPPETLYVDSLVSLCESNYVMTIGEDTLFHGKGRFACSIEDRSGIVTIRAITVPYTSESKTEIKYHCFKCSGNGAASLTINLN